jgi:hypothetical protein
MMNKRKIGIAIGVLAVLIVGVVWAFHARANGQIQKIREMQREMLASGKPPEPEQFDKIRKEMDNLSDSQREEVMKQGAEDMQRRMNREIDGYFETPKEKQNEYLDKKIKDMDARMKRMFAGGPPKGMPPPKDGGGPPPRRPGGEERSQMKNQMLDHGTPEQRAKGAAYFAALMKRRKELGLPMFPGPPRR